MEIPQILIKIRDRLEKMSSTVEATKRNIEIKARIADESGYEKRVEIAKKLTKTTGEILNQRDVFYKANNGRLKLRMEVRIAPTSYYRNLIKLLNL